MSAAEPVKDDRSASRALLGKGSFYTLATAAQLTGALLVQPVLSRALSKAEMGRVSLAIVVTALLGLLLTLGLPAVVTRQYFRSDERVGVRPLVGLCVWLAVVLGLGAFALGPLWAAELGGFDLPLVLGTATAITFSMIITGQAVQRARGQAGKFVLVTAVNVLGGQLVGLVAVFTVSRGATAYLMGVGVGSIIAASMSLVWARPSFTGWQDKAALKEWFGIALPTVPHTAALYLMTAGDRFVVQIQRGNEATAAYSLAYLAGALGITLVAAANNAWAPLVYGAPEKRRWEVLAVTTEDMLRVGAIIAAGLAMTAPLALAVVADPSKYDVPSLVPVVAITAFATVPNVLYLASAHVLFWTGRTTALLWITPLSVALNLAAKAVVLPKYGFVGAAEAATDAKLR